MVVFSSDLSSYKSVLSCLEKEISDSNKIISDINQFKTLSSTLKGPGYKEVFSMMDQYAGVMKNRAEVALALKNSINSALDSMLGYMGGYSKLDDAEVPELKASLATAKSNRASIEASIRQVKNSEDKSNLGFLQGSLSTIDATIKELEEHIKLLEGLASADASAFSGIASVNVSSGLSI